MSYKNQRSPIHDYHSRSIYLITINKASGISYFSHVTKGQDDNFYASLTGLGKIIVEQLKLIQKEYQEAKILQYIIMPDHIHFIIFIKETTNYTLGKLIGQFTGYCTRAYGIGIAIFKPGFHDRILHSKDQLQRMYDYIKDNPRRLYIRQKYKNYFNCPCTLKIRQKTYCTYGNFLLLRSPSKVQVRVSSKYSTDELQRLNRLWEETINEGGVLISPFISHAERDVENLAITNGANIIIVTDEEISPRFKPKGKLFELCAQGRLLLVSTFQKTTYLDTEHIYQMTREKAMEMNDLAKTLVELSTEALTLKPLEHNSQLR